MGRFTWCPWQWTRRLGDRTPVVDPPRDDRERHGVTMGTRSRSVPSSAAHALLTFSRHHNHEQPSRSARRLVRRRQRVAREHRRAVLRWLPHDRMNATYDAVVIGTGFGGAVSGCRLAQAGLAVGIFERGRRYPMGSFPRNWRNPLDGWLWSH